MSERLPNRKPKRLWILMYQGREGWLPSIDHLCAWRTKKAADQKVLSLCDSRYQAFPYTAGKP